MLNCSCLQCKSNASWCRDRLNEILIQGNVLYSHISNSAGEDFLLSSEIPSALSSNNETFSMNFSSSFAGDLRMLETVLYRCNMGLIC